MGYLDWFWSFKQCQIWVPSNGVDFKSNKIWVGYSQKVCDTTVLEHSVASDIILKSHGVREKDTMQKK